MGHLPSGSLILLFVEVEGGGVDAVAQAGGLGAVGEDMAEVASAAGTGDLGAHHAVAAVFDLLDVLPVQGIGEAGPAASGVELGIGGEELEAAGGAEIDAGGAGFGVLSGEWPLGTLLAQDAVLLGSERTAPLFVRLANLVHSPAAPLGFEWAAHLL